LARLTERWRASPTQRDGPASIAWPARSRERAPGGSGRSSGLAASRTYSYDLDANRLTRVEGGTTTTFTYDRTDVAISQNSGAATFTYDRYGNLTSAPDAANAQTSYAFDEAGRLTTITPPTGSAATFTVDPLDRHATRTVGASTDTYGYVNPSETAFETGTSGSRSLLDLDGSRLAVKNGSTVAWLVFDLHGSVAALCTAGGSTLTDAYRYDGYGQTVASSGSSLEPWKYRGLLAIAPGGLSDSLYDMGARDYAPALGTFTQEDSVQGSAANPLSFNRYLYALADPATLVDPDGHMAAAREGGGTLSPAQEQRAELAPHVWPPAPPADTQSEPTPPIAYGPDSPPPPPPAPPRFEPGRPDSRGRCGSGVERAGRVIGGLVMVPGGVLVTGIGVTLVGLGVGELAAAPVEAAATGPFGLITLGIAVSGGLDIIGYGVITAGTGVGISAGGIALIGSAVCWSPTDRSQDD
jgi:RHS repeat-associated protein